MGHSRDECLGENELVLWLVDFSKFCRSEIDVYAMAGTWLSTMLYEMDREMDVWCDGIHASACVR